MLYTLTNMYKINMVWTVNLIACVTFQTKLCCLVLILGLSRFKSSLLCWIKIKVNMPKSHKVLLSTFRNWRFQEIGFKKEIVDGTVFVSEVWFFYIWSDIVLKYKEKPVIIRYFSFSHYTNGSPCLLQKSFSSCSSIAPLKSSRRATYWAQRCT